MQMAKKYNPTFEIITRNENQPRPGWYALTIDGIDCDVTIDAAQWMPKCLIEANGDTAKAMELCVARAEDALQRRADRLMSARQLGHGIDFVEPAARLTPQETIQQYLNRGRLDGLTQEQRIARMTKRAQKFDNDRDWADRRAKLIVEAKAELADWENKLAVDPTNAKFERMIAITKNRIAGLSPRVVNVIHGFQYAYTQYWTAAINLSTDDIRLWPYMTNTTLDTVRDAVDTFSDVTLDEFDGTNYSSGGLALDTQTVAVDDANDRAEFDCADEVVSSLGAGTRSMQGVAVGKFNTNTAGSLPLHAIDFATNKTPDGSDFTFAINAEGLMQMADG
jgi:hypothetical protein